MVQLSRQAVNSGRVVIMNDGIINGIYDYSPTSATEKSKNMWGKHAEDEGQSSKVVRHGVPDGQAGGLCWITYRMTYRQDKKLRHVTLLFLGRLASPLDLIREQSVRV
ncbi:hypothetical protein J6590_069127 [Homalodisca vitripennis]|nr:hypothetical protein J6590_069127 [Homalodisca vitripennis]